MGNTLCGEIVYVPLDGDTKKRKYEVPCRGAVGNTVEITLKDECLTLCKVEARGKTSELQITGSCTHTYYHIIHTAIVNSYMLQKPLL